MKTLHATVARYKDILAPGNASAGVATSSKISVENSEETALPSSGGQTPVVATLSTTEASIAFDDELGLKPKYTQEFKIQTKSIRIDKSLPKIFID